MPEPIRLGTLTAAQRAELKPDDRIVIADNTTHRLGTVLIERDDASGEYIKAVAFSLTADRWLNLLTGYPAHDPRADAELERVARYYDARELAVDLDAARRLAEHLRRTEPHRYAATVALLTDPQVWADEDGLCVCPLARHWRHAPGRRAGCQAGQYEPAPESPTES
ncbi:hypothetical protein [Micromonospora sp. CPCC 206061]|uniref:hypothetical protein n=1 Tax=Micromonospora sp. CPCC 206061 TaxID=3122410 RepID=UPI002FF2F029